MHSEEFEPLRLGLKLERKQLMEELERLNAHPADERREGSSFSKVDEEATETFELEKRLALEKRLSDQLAEVEHALDKFELGTYGVCDNCGQPIELARLEALPQASLCISCKVDQVKNVKGSRKNSN